MFTGIIDVLGKVERRTAATLAIKAKIKKPKLGASIAINGVCLTAVKSKNGVHAFDVGPETWSRTNLGALKAGQAVNLETALLVGQEIGGHFVSGHVDSTAEILALEPWNGEFGRLRVELPEVLRGLVAAKGSIAVDGISLTVASVEKNFFEIMIVPHTLQTTTLGRRKAGERVNIEVDPLARYAMTAALKVVSGLKLPKFLHLASLLRNLGNLRPDTI